MSVSSKIGLRIKELREKAGMSQDVLAQKMKLPRPAISQFESGTRKVSADELVGFSQLFRVPVEDLLNPGVLTSNVVQYSIARSSWINHAVTLDRLW